MIIIFILVCGSLRKKSIFYLYELFQSLKIIFNLNFLNFQYNTVIKRSFKINLRYINIIIFIEFIKCSINLRSISRTRYYFTFIFYIFDIIYCNKRESGTRKYTKSARFRFDLLLPVSGLRSTTGRRRPQRKPRGCYGPKNNQ